MIRFISLKNVQTQGQRERIRAYIERHHPNKSFKDHDVVVYSDADIKRIEINYSPITY